MPTKPKLIHGDDLIYRFLRDMFTDDHGVYGEVPRALLAATAVWLPPSVYRSHALLAPYVVRDPACRGRNGSPDEWGSPDADGFLRDDNSLIKGIPRSLSILAPSQPHLNGRRMATEFVASHVWRQCTDDGPLASRRPLLNSFVPNVVWLPSQIAKLTDVEGSLVQRTLQAMSWSLYRHAEIDDRLREVVEDAWALLPTPTNSEEFETTCWNYFVPSERFLQARSARVDTVVAAIDAVLQGNPLPAKVITTRYTQGLPGVDAEALNRIRRFLTKFVTA